MILKKMIHILGRFFGGAAEGEVSLTEQKKKKAGDVVQLGFVGGALQLQVKVLKCLLWNDCVEGMIPECGGDAKTCSLVLEVVLDVVGLEAVQVGAFAG